MLFGKLLPRQRIQSGDPLRPRRVAVGRVRVQVRAVRLPAIHIRVVRTKERTI